MVQQALSAGIIDDLEYFDFVEQITFLVRGDDDQFTSYTGNADLHALRRSVGMGSRAFGPASVQVDDTVWHIQVDHLSDVGITPKQRDRILDVRGVYWNILDVSTETLGTRYRLTCNRVRSP